MTSNSLNKSVIFVCYGNICRSTMAEAIFKDIIKKRKIESEWLVDSAGTGDHERGSPVDHMAARVLKKHDILSDHKARQIKKDDFDRFSYILAFDHMNIEDIEAVKPQSSKAIVKLLNFYNPNEKDREIPDPWGYGESTFDKVFKSCYDACEGFLKAI